MKVSEWNYAIVHTSMRSRKNKGIIILVCDEPTCGGEMVDTNHMDDSNYPHKRQVVCDRCSCVNYRLE